MAVRIRSREQDDVDQLVPILHHVYLQDGYPVEGVNSAKSMIAGRELLAAWVAEVDGKVAGHIAIGADTSSDIAVDLWQEQRPLERVASVGKLFVDPASRGKGAASQLVASAMQWARSHSTRLVLFALEKDRAAQELYLRMGWVKYGEGTYRWGDEQRMKAICFASPRQN